MSIPLQTPEEVRSAFYCGGKIVVSPAVGRETVLARFLGHPPKDTPGIVAAGVPGMYRNSWGEPSEK